MNSSTYWLMDDASHRFQEPFTRCYRPWNRCGNPGKPSKKSKFSKFPGEFSRPILEG